MKEVSLGRVLSKGEAAALVRGIVSAVGTSAVWDTDGSLLLGVTGRTLDQMPEKHAVLCDGEAVGWVSGGEQPDLIAAFLNYLLTQEAEKEELLDEILELYRQVNLLFDLSEKLAASLELETVAGTILREASRLIKATGGAVVLSGKERPRRFLATIGQGITPLPDLGSRSGVVGEVLAGGRAEIVNRVRLDPRYMEAVDSIHSLICAPLTLKKETIGAVVLVSQVPVMYTAADLKLLNTLASQSAPSIEHALLYERTLQEAQEREERLRRQVQELRIELDEAKQKERVAEITSSEYYQRLRDRADTLRHIIGGTGAP